MNAIAATLNDPALVASRAAFRASNVAHALTPFLEGKTIMRVDVGVLRHRPGRRALLEYRFYIRGPRGGVKRRILLAKAYKSARARHVFDVLRQAHEAGFASSGRFQAPAPVAVFSDWRVVVYERIAGAALSSRSEAHAFASAGTAIAAFHAAPMHFEEIRTPEDELTDAVRLLCEAAVGTPRLLAVGKPILERLKDAISFMETALPRPLHRDFYPAQVLLGHGAPALIDLDDAAMGDPALDAGNFLAHLHLFPARVHQMAATAFCHAVLRGEALPQVNVQFYEAVSLVRIAGVHAVRYGRTRLAGRLLREAQHLLID